ncbi:hypothetical protein [Streptomyces sp. NPDC085596]|uniref:hypothetical protein n=1 Tax=Streptomyces sp. NPDC085596 TaxID=3365731 RepID=UPI0037D8820A
MTRFFEEFEPPEGIKIELLRGEVVMMAAPDLVHNRIVTAVQDRAQRVTKFGAPLPLETLGVELDTADFGTYKAVRPHRYP